MKLEYRDFTIVTRPTWGGGGVDAVIYHGLTFIYEVVGHDRDDAIRRAKNVIDGRYTDDDQDDCFLG